MNEKLNKQSIIRLDIPDKIINILQSDNIMTLGELCKKSKKELKNNFNLNQNEIIKINTELQLLGLNLRNSL